MRRLLAALAVALGLVGVLFVASPAQADPYPYTGCHTEYDTTYAAYYTGSYWVSAAEWHAYDSTEIPPGDPCFDINVQIANTGGFTVRTQVCPAPGQTWSCYSMGWGALTALGPTYGVTLHSYHMPCGGACVFLFRIETSSTNAPSSPAENLTVAF